ncbi:MAG: DUF4082 domain-containing protein, partial [Actinobacteria bacterium]|nr:DUF4082 domain-containing protein [Actinomycetota bacterium]
MDDNGGHSAHVWSADGTLLTSQAFVGETSSGWQTVRLNKPVFIAANESFTVSVYGATYAWNPNNGFEVHRGPLTVLSASNTEAEAPQYPEGYGMQNMGVDFLFETSSSSAPIRNGYTLQGWSATDGGSAVSLPYTPGVLADITLYAVWTADSHIVSFNSKGGSSVTAGSFVTDGSLSAPSAPTRAGYTFLGWSATDGGSALVFPYSPGVTEDITLYAKWSADSHVVDFNSKGGSNVSANSFVTGGSLSAPTSPTRSGYTFIGWAATDGGSALVFPYSPQDTTDITLYALWSGVSAMAGGARHTCAVVSGGVKCWGYNSSGQLGDGTVVSKATPTDVIPVGSGATAIAAGSQHTCAVVSGGVKCWGNNSRRQLGDGTQSQSNSPTQIIASGSGVTAIAAGELFTCAVVSGGVKCWGANGSGQLGYGFGGYRTLVQTIASGSGVTAIAAGFQHACAVVSGGVKCWGSNDYGQLGDATEITKAFPTQTIASGSGVTAIAAGSYHSCAVVSGGVKCWGYNADGELGDGTKVRKSSATQTITSGSGVTAIAAGYNHTCAVVSGGVKCWGYNADG